MREDLLRSRQRICATLPVSSGANEPKRKKISHMLISGGALTTSPVYGLSEQAARDFGRALD
jgi:hypothetical protein